MKGKEMNKIEKKKDKVEEKRNPVTYNDKRIFLFVILSYLELVVPLLHRCYILGPKLIKNSLWGHCLAHAKWKTEHSRYTSWIKVFAQVAHDTFIIFHWPSNLHGETVLSMRHRGMLKLYTIIQALKFSFIQITCAFFSLIISPQTIF